MADLKNPKWMYAKAAMFLIIGIMTFGLLLLPQELWARIALQLLMIWAFARAYYFAFYVIEHYVDGDYRFAGLLDFAKYLLNVRQTKHPGGSAEQSSGLRTTIRTIYAADRQRRVVVFRRKDGSYGFEEQHYSGDPLEECWLYGPRHSECHCPTEEIVLRECTGRVTWLADSIAADREVDGLS